MTAKLNLSPLINYFSDKNQTIASKLSGLTKQAQEKPFESAFLSEEGLKDKIDNCTPATLEECKNAVAKVIAESSHFGKAGKIKHVRELQAIKSPQKLQFFFYNYILAASKMKVSNTTQAKKLAQVLVEIADQLDTTEPELAAEADAILRELHKQAGMGCSNMEMGHEHSEKCMGGGSPGVMLVMDEAAPMGGQMMMDDSEFGASPVDENMEPSIEDMKDPEPERDEVTLDDLRERLESMKWRVADRAGREALQQAIEHVEKAQQHHGAKRSRLDKAHEIFDHAGLALRVKDFE